VLRNKPTWDKVVRLATTGRDFGRNTAYTIDPTGVRIVRDTDADRAGLRRRGGAGSRWRGRAVSADAEAALADKPAAPLRQTYDTEQKAREWMIRRPVMRAFMAQLLKQPEPSDE
jgi:hypothetical protein